MMHKLINKIVERVCGDIKTRKHSPASCMMRTLLSYNTKLSITRNIKQSDILLQELTVIIDV